MSERYGNVVCYGAGWVFSNLRERGVIQKCHVDYLADRDVNKQGTYISGLPVIKPDRIPSLGSVMVIVCMQDSDEAEQYLDGLGIPHVHWTEVICEISRDRPVSEAEFASNSIIRAYGLLGDDRSRETYTEVIANRLAPEYSTKRWGGLASGTPYFNQEFFRIAPDECYVDCGAYVGDSLKGFIETVANADQNNPGKKNDITDAPYTAYCFEMAHDNYARLSGYAASLNNKNISCYNMGVYSGHGRVMYGNEDTSGGASYSLYKPQNPREAVVDTLDSVLAGRRVTFIKMDIEGAELEALKGSRGIIMAQKPKLAICLYHRVDDLWNIPCYLHDICPDYHFGIMHHSGSCLDTVLYAYVPNIRG